MSERDSLFLLRPLLAVWRQLTWRRCTARSPEGFRCYLADPHNDVHVPLKGRGWAWGGNYGKFWTATPSGLIQLQVNNPDGAAVFETGKDYYVDFTAAE